MYIIGITITRGCLFLLILLCWIAGNKASTLLYSKSEEKLHHNVRQVCSWATYISIPAIGVIVGMLVATVTSATVSQQDGLLFIFLILIPLLMIWLSAMPRLRKLTRSTGRQSANPLDVRSLSRSTQPGLIVPFHLSAMSALVALSFSLNLSMPVTISNTGLPIVLLLILTFGLWMSHLSRSSLATLPDAIIKDNYRSRLLLQLLIVIVTALIGAIPFYTAIQNF